MRGQQWPGVANGLFPEWYLSHIKCVNMNVQGLNTMLKKNMPFNFLQEWNWLPSCQKVPNYSSEFIPLTYESGCGLDQQSKYTALQFGELILEH